jgi:OCT family organic cation transporter-like MFS transporter 4/5
LQSLLYFGSLLGFFVIPYIADNWGRRIAMRISWTFFVIGILFNLLADSPNMVGMGQLLTGFGCNPAITLCYSFLNEQVLRKKRQYYGLFIQVSLAIG